MNERKIGQGLQFNIYNLGDKIEKIPTTKKQIKRKLIWWSLSYLFKPKALEEKASKTIQKRKKVLKNLKEKKINKELFANLEFKKGRIIQDRVIPLKRLFKKRKFNEIKKILKKYPQLIFNCWKNKFSEETFNFKLNLGVDKKNKLIIMDFGELIFNKELLKKEIKTKRWEKSHDFKWSNKKLKNYYKELMNNQITLKNLEKYWK